MAEFSLILRVLEQGSELVKRKLKACKMNTERQHYNDYKGKWTKVDYLDFRDSLRGQGKRCGGPANAAIEDIFSIKEI